MLERPGNYWYMLPEYSQARKSMWDAINPHTGRLRIDDIFPREIRSFTREHEMMLGIANSTFQLVGSDNFNSLVGSPPVGMVFSEYALSNPSAWGYLMPILEENGGWVGFNSTPRGKNHFRSHCTFAEKEPGWFCEALTADDTGIYSPDQLASILRQLQATHGEDYGRALFLQEYYVSFDAAIPGSIWGEALAKAQAQGRIGVVPVDTQFPVSTAWDLGYEDATAIWFFQLVAGDIRIIDYHESNHKDIAFYIELLKAKAKEHGCTYATHWLPHDARPRTLAAGGKSMLQQFNDTKLWRFAIVPRLDKQEGIQAARTTLSRCWFNEATCEKGLEALHQYHHEWDEENKCFTINPVHDFSSHGADAFRYLSLCWKHPKSKEPTVALGDRLERGNITAVSFGAMKARFFRKKKDERMRLFH
jgi:phage terminase large subunit